jgi:hypothetical protein
VLTPAATSGVITRLHIEGQTVTDLVFVFRIPLFLLVLILLVFALPAGLVAGAALVAFLAWRWLVRKSRIEQERRHAAILLAVDALPRAERYDWYNKEGK